jgi:hypothetical protein
LALDCVLQLKLESFRKHLVYHGDLQNVGKQIPLGWRGLALLLLPLLRGVEARIVGHMFNFEWVAAHVCRRLRGVLVLTLNIND